MNAQLFKKYFLLIGISLCLFFVLFKNLFYEPVFQIQSHLGYVLILNSKTEYITVCHIQGLISEQTDGYCKTKSLNSLVEAGLENKNLRPNVGGSLEQDISKEHKGVDIWFNELLK